MDADSTPENLIAYQSNASLYKTTRRAGRWADTDLRPRRHSSDARPGAVSPAIVDAISKIIKSER